MSIPAKSRPGATGPRTPLGKKRSSRNSLKHGIFMKLDTCKVLHAAGRFGLHSKNLLEDSICSQIANNLAQRSAIEQFAAREKKEASLALFRKWEETERQETMKLIPPLRENGDRGPLPDVVCKHLLMGLKRTLIERGSLAAEDKDCIDFIYGDHPNWLAKELKWAIYLASITDADETEKRGIEAMNLGVQGCIGLIDDEIEFLEQREKSDSSNESEWVALPPDDVMEKISRYQTSNSRELTRLLANFETLRRLSNLKS